MPSELPFIPAALEVVREQPKRQHTSDFTGFVQQVRTLSPYWRGTFSFAPTKTQNEIEAWQAWAAAQAHADDPSFWIPLKNFSRTSAGASQSASVDSNNPRRLSIASSPPVVGSIIEIVSSNHPTISVCRVVTSNPSDGVYEIDDTLPDDFPTPFVVIKERPRVRALALNTDAMGAGINTHGFYAFSKVEWQEALGQTIREIQAL